MNNLFDPNEYDQYIDDRKFNQSQIKMQPLLFWNKIIEIFTF